jgi:hypothetical protein
MPRIEVIPRELSEEDVQFFINIGLEQARIMDGLREALRSGDVVRALEAVRRVVGLDDEARKR